MANISTWLDQNSQTHKMPGVMKYQHFRIFVPDSHPDEVFSIFVMSDLMFLDMDIKVWLQARTWPGAPCPTNSGDCWRGLAEGENYINVFPKKDHQPDLHRDRHCMPPSARPQGQTMVTDKVLERHINNFQTGNISISWYSNIPYLFVH